MEKKPWDLRRKGQTERWGSGTIEERMRWKEFRMAFGVNSTSRVQRPRKQKVWGEMQVVRLECRERDHLGNN